MCMIIECVTASRIKLSSSQDPDNLSSSLGFNMRYYPSVPSGFTLDRLSLFPFASDFILSLFYCFFRPAFPLWTWPDRGWRSSWSRKVLYEFPYSLGKARLFGLDVISFSRSGSRCGTEGATLPVFYTLFFWIGYEQHRLLWLLGTLPWTRELASAVRDHNDALAL